MAVKEALDLVKEVSDLAEQFKNVELKEKLVNLKNELVDLKEEMVDLKEENRNLKEIKSKNVVYNENLTECYEILESGEKVGPYCTRCWQVDHRLVSLYPMDNGSSKWHSCPNCETNTPMVKYRKISSYSSNVI